MSALLPLLPDLSPRCLQIPVFPRYFVHPTLCFVCRMRYIILQKIRFVGCCSAVSEDNQRACAARGSTDLNDSAQRDHHRLVNMGDVTTRLQFSRPGRCALCVWLLLHMSSGVAGWRTEEHTRMCLRGGSGAMVGNARSPLRTFIRQTSAAALSHNVAGLAGAASNQGGFGFAANSEDAAEADRPAAHSTGKSIVVDEEGDSLMGRPCAAGTARLLEGGQGVAEVQNRGSGWGVGEHGQPGPSGAASSSSPWAHGTPVPFKYICSKLIAAAAEDEQGMAQRLSVMVTEIWRHSPDDLTAFVCLMRDQIMSPTLQGIELLPAAQLSKVVADSLAKTPEGLREALANNDGDLAVTAQKLRGSQRTLFSPPPLTLGNVVIALRDVATRRDMAERFKGAKTLVVAASSDEAFILIKALEGTLRYIGLSKHVIISALAAAAVDHSPSFSPSLPSEITQPTTSSRDAPGPHASAAQTQASPILHQGGSDGVEMTPAVLVAVLWQAVSVVADWRKVVPALMSHGPHGILGALNVDMSRQRASCARGAKLRALQRTEFLEGGGVLHAPTSQAEEEAQIARERSFAALTFGVRYAVAVSLFGVCVFNFESLTSIICENAPMC